jgi:hypothetical protein
MPTSQKYLLQLAFIMAVVVLPSSLMGQQSTSSAGTIPEGWYVYPEDKLKAWPENSTWSPCPDDSLSLADWQVSAEGDAVRITKLLNDRTSIQNRSEQLPLPRLLKHEQGMPGQTVRAGLKSVLHFKNNWLLAYDGGEWGGGLWLTNDDGSETKRILSDNVREMAAIDNGVLVLSGLSHFIDFGNVFIFSNPDGMNISLQHAVHLDGAPSVYAKEPNGSVLFVTTYGLCRIAKSGELQRLTGLPGWSQHAFTNSMVITSDGSIFIGTRMFVLRIRKNSDRYRTEWLLPRECR